MNPGRLSDSLPRTSGAGSSCPLAYPFGAPPRLAASKILMRSISVLIDISFYNVISTNIILVARRVVGSGDARELFALFRRAPLRLAPQWFAGSSCRHAPQFWRGSKRGQPKLSATHSPTCHLPTRSRSISELGGFMKWTLLFSAIFFLLVSPAAHAQGVGASGQIRGVIYDPSGGVVPNVTVEAVDTGKGTQYAALSDSSGQYLFPNLSPAIYDLTTQAAGLQTQVQKGLSLQVGQTAIVRSEEHT